MMTGFKAWRVLDFNYAPRLVFLYESYIAATEHAFPYYKTEATGNHSSKFLDNIVWS
jgi:hypothetical protein